MALYTNDGTPVTINVSLPLFDPTCTVGNQPWRKEAWWPISPGQTVDPHALDVNPTVNQCAGEYAFPASGDHSCQGTGNAWIEAASGVHFNQYGEPKTNCTDWVDYYVFQL